MKTAPVTVSTLEAEAVKNIAIRATIKAAKKQTPPNDRPTDLPLLDFFKGDPHTAAPTVAEREPPQEPHSTASTVAPLANGSTSSEPSHEFEGSASAHSGPSTAASQTAARTPAPTHAPSTRESLNRKRRPSLAEPRVEAPPPKPCRS